VGINFLVPAIAMRSLAEEFKTGTFEILQTKPSFLKMQIVGGKYFFYFTGFAFVIVPSDFTQTFYFIKKTLVQLAILIVGALVIKLYRIVLSAARLLPQSALCCSSFTHNAVVAFSKCILYSLVLYFGFNAVSKLPVFVGRQVLPY
jgi:ABC-2 type transport system permease protein